MIRCSEIDPKKKGRVKKETVAARGVVKPEGLACDWVTKKVSKALARISSNLSCSCKLLKRGTIWGVPLVPLD